MKDFLFGFSIIPATFGVFALYAWGYWPKTPGPYFTLGMVSCGATIIVGMVAVFTQITITK